MKLATALSVVAMLFASGASAQPTPGRSRTPAAPAADPCDLLGQPQACDSCPGLLAALRLPGSGSGDLGLAADGIVWSPMFVAFRLNCQEAGRMLLTRGANPQRGGRAAALLAEVVAQRFVRAGQPAAVRQAQALDWVALLARPRPFELDVSDGDGMMSARAAFTAARADGTLPPGAGVIWSRIEAASAAYPILMVNAERTNVDTPAPDTGITRPSETAISRGVEAMLSNYERGGMAELTIRVQSCWAEPRQPGLPQAKWRWRLEYCAALDLAAAIFDEATALQIGMPRVEFFLNEPLFRRISAIEEFKADGLQQGPYIKALYRSVTNWLPIQYAARKKS